MSLTNLARILVITFFLLLAGVAIWLDYTHEEKTAYLFVDSEFGRLVAHGLISVAPELAGIVIGVVSIDYLNEKRQEEDKKKQLKASLIRDMGSSVQSVAIKATEELRAHGWLQDGSLVNANLNGANLAGANLKGINLEGATLTKANLEQTNLEDAILIRANLERSSLDNANLTRTNLEMTDLEGANLTEAKLIGANLTRANLERTNLIKANLTWANLEGAILTRANLDKTSLEETNLRRADLENVENCTDKQFKRAHSLEGATMPNGRLYES